MFLRIDRIVSKTRLRPRNYVYLYTNTVITTLFARLCRTTVLILHILLFYLEHSLALLF